VRAHHGLGERGARAHANPVGAGAGVARPGVLAGTTAGSDECAIGPATPDECAIRPGGLARAPPAAPSSLTSAHVGRSQLGESRSRPDSGWTSASGGAVKRRSSTLAHRPRSLPPAGPGSGACGGLDECAITPATADECAVRAGGLGARTPPAAPPRRATSAPARTPGSTGLSGGSCPQPPASRHLQERDPILIRPRSGRSRGSRGCGQLRAHREGGQIMIEQPCCCSPGPRAMRSTIRQAAGPHSRWCSP
jgi:hypothetical protein